jgi:thioredoxin-dependent peroxiredoxin
MSRYLSVFGNDISHRARLAAYRPSYRFLSPGVIGWGVLPCGAICLFSPTYFRSEEQSMKILTTIGAVLFAVAGFISTAAAAAKVGDQAPDFELQGSDGQTHHLADYKDKQAVVLAWFPKAFTGGCTAECKSMKEEGDAIRKYDVAYFMISVDPQDGEKGNKAFAEKYSADFPILSDPDKKVANDYGVLKLDTAHRWTFYIDKSGKIAYIEKHVDTTKAGKDVAAKLKDLGVDEKK